MILPAFTTFKANTLSLRSKYSTALGRYKVVDSAVPQTSLEVLMARTNEVIRCETDRKSQVEVFRKLVDELRQIPRDDEEKVEQGTLFLLGALIHRYFRIIKEYDEYNSYASWAIFATSDITKCNLFVAIRKALQFKDFEVVRKFKEDDLKILDVVTLVHALEVFQKNMFLEDEKKIPRYMKYPHFADDNKHFKDYLQTIISEQSRRGALLLKRFKAIAFLKSLANTLENDHQQSVKDIQKWCKGVIKEYNYKDFNSFISLDEDAIEASVKKYIEAEKSRNIILDLFYTPMIRDKLDSLDRKNFCESMLDCYDKTCSLRLFGGYALLLLQYKSSLDSDLLFIFQKILSLGSSSLDTLKKQDMLKAVRILQKFIELEPDAVFDYEFFGGKDKMHTAMARAEKELAAQVVPDPMVVLVHG